MAIRGVWTTNLAAIYLASGLLGVGIGLAFAEMANLIVGAVSPTETGVATAMNTVARFGRDQCLGQPLKGERHVVMSSYNFSNGRRLTGMDVHAGGESVLDKSGPKSRAAYP